MKIVRIVSIIIMALALASCSSGSGSDSAASLGSGDGGELVVAGSATVGEVSITFPKAVLVSTLSGNFFAVPAEDDAAAMLVKADAEDADLSLCLAADALAATITDDGNADGTTLTAGLAFEEGALDPGSAVIVCVLPDAVEYAAGGKVSGTAFRVAAEEALLAFGVWKLDPARGATGVAPEGNVQVHFKTAAKSDDLTAESFLLKSLVERKFSVVKAAVSLDTTGKIATLDPDEILEEDTQYFAFLQGTIRDEANGARLGATIIWSFTTGTQAAIAWPPCDAGNCLAYMTDALGSGSCNPYMVDGEMGDPGKAPSGGVGYDYSVEAVMALLKDMKEADKLVALACFISSATDDGHRSTIRNGCMPLDLLFTLMAAKECGLGGGGGEEGGGEEGGGEEGGGEVSPVLSLSSDTSAFSCEVGGACNSDTLLVSNSGGGTLNWAIECSDSGTGVCDYVVISPSSGSSSAGQSNAVSVTAVLPEGAPAGSYSAILMVSDPVVASTPLALTITVVKGDEPEGCIYSSPMSNNSVTYHALLGSPLSVGDIREAINAGGDELEVVPYADDMLTVTSDGALAFTASSPLGDNDSAYIGATSGSYDLTVRKTCDPESTATLTVFITVHQYPIDLHFWGWWGSKDAAFDDLDLASGTFNHNGYNLVYTVVSASQPVVTTFAQNGDIVSYNPNGDSTEWSFTYRACDLIETETCSPWQTICVFIDENETHECNR